MSRTEQFIRERKYLLNVSPSTVDWYEHALRWLPSETPSQLELNAMVVRMREAGLNPGGCNAACRAINAYLKWSGSACHIKPMKEPQFIPPTFSAEDVRKLLRWKPSDAYERRLHLLVLLLLDCGLRISEALGLKWADVDMDGLLLTVHGKGGKDRCIPFSMELRRHFLRFQEGRDGQRSHEVGYCS